MKILIGIPAHVPDQRFLESLPNFFRDVSKDYNAELTWVWGKKLVDAQNEIAEKFLSGDWTHLLFLEDDHWGHTKEMLDSCLSANAPVSAISYRSRHFPFGVIPMIKSHENSSGHMQYKGFDENATGFHPVDLCGFGFTLIRRDVLESLDKPLFRLNWGVGPQATDIDFCQRVTHLGFNLVGCYDYRLNHREITDEGVKELFVEGITAKHSMYTRLHQMLVQKRKLNLVGKEE